MDELSIKVNIADRIYPLSVNPAEEEKVRRAAKLISEKLKAYGHQFSARDKQDILAMCSLELATDLINMQEEAASETENLTVQMKEITALLHHVTI